MDRRRFLSGIGVVAIFPLTGCSGKRTVRVADYRQETSIDVEDGNGIWTWSGMLALDNYSPFGPASDVRLDVSLFSGGSEIASFSKVVRGVSAETKEVEVSYIGSVKEVNSISSYTVSASIIR